MRMDKNLKKLLNNIQEYIGAVKKRGYIISIIAGPKKIRPKAIALIYQLINRYQDEYFITIENLPYCIMPDATEHIINPAKKNRRRADDYEASCKNCIYYAACPGWENFEHLDKALKKPVNDAPREIAVEITNKCNLSCSTCVLDKTHTSQANLSTIKTIIDEAKEMGIPAIRFTGGEPLLNLHLKSMLAYAKRKKFYTLLNTNAVCSGSSLLNIIEKNVDNILVSLQGFDRESDQKLTGVPQQGFNEKIANIVRLKAKVPVVRVGTVISATLINNINSYYSLLKKIGITYWNLFRPITGQQNKEFQISKSDMLKIMSFIFHLKRYGIKAKITNPVPFCISPDIGLSLTTLSGGSADDGHTRIVWDARGYFKPSYFIEENLGNDIKSAWNNPFIEKLQSMSYLPKECKICHYLKWCCGGSRAIAKKIYGDYFTRDPWS